jgi:aryl-alcohol dehydrogenase-like predicted oxidoreductase
VLAELAALASSGVTIGLTVSGPSQAATIRRAFDVIVDGVNPFRSVQATWNLLERSAGEALADAHARGWGVIVKEALANGRLRDRAHEAIAAAAVQPWADVVLSGAVTEEQLHDSIAAVSAADRIGDEGQASVTSEPPELYWATRARLPWA